MLPEGLPYMKSDEAIARQLSDFNDRLQHLERLEDPAGGYDEGARVFNDANTLILHGVATILTFNSERYDTDAIHSVFLNTGRLTCNTAGVYVMSGHIRWSANPVETNLRIRLNGITYIASDNVVAQKRRQLVATIYKLAVTDFIELEASQASGGPINVLSTGNESPEFAMSRIGIG